MKTETSILGRDELLEMLKNGKIFKPGTWTKDNLGAATYDLRVSEDFLVVPDENDPHWYRRHPKGDKRKAFIVLNPGDVAFISSQEKISMPWNLAAHIGIKFALARKGVLLLTGVFVAPGYGMEKWNGSLVPKEDERIHFLVANLGSETVKLNPGHDKIGSLQFFRVAEPPDELKPKLYIEGEKEMEQEFFLDDTRQQGLVFVNQIKQAMDKITSLEVKLRTTNTKLDTMEKSSKQIVMFGIYLLCASMVVGASAFILSILASEKCLAHVEELFKRLPNAWPQALSLIAIIVAAILAVKYAVQLVNFLRSKFT